MSKLVHVGADGLRLDPGADEFVQQFMLDLDPDAAGVRCGLKAGQGKRLLKNPHIAHAIAVARAERSIRVGVNADRVLEKLGGLLNADRRDIYQEDGTLKHPKDMAPETAMLITGFKTKRVLEKDEDGEAHPVEVLEVKIADPVAVLQLAMRHLGMLNDKLDVTVTNLVERMDRAQSRVSSDLEIIDGVAVVVEDHAERERLLGEELLG